MKKVIAQIITPPVASSDRELDLVELTKFLSENLNLDTSCGLGGAYGYGVEYKNDVFEMFPYYWGECTCGQTDIEFDEPHEEHCYQELVDKELLQKGWKKDEDGWLERPKKMSWEESKKIEDGVREKYCKQFGLTFPAGCAVHCTCSHDKRFDKWYKEHKKGKNWHADDCLLEKPNFKHFESGLEVRWYKWIGRDMEYNKKIKDNEWRNIFDKCIKSVEVIENSGVGSTA